MKFSLSLILPAAMLSAASAATPSYSTDHFAADGSNVSILANTGTLVNAVNFSTAPVRSGVFSSTNPDPSVTLNGIAFVPTPWNASSTLFNWNTAGIDNDRDSNVNYSAAPALDGLVYDVIRTSGNGVGMAFNLTNLNIGQQYRAQFVFSASDAARRLYLTSQADADLAGPSNILVYGVNDGAGLLTATFTADATTQTFNFYNTNTGSQRVSLAGYDLFAVPEGSSSALLLLGMVGTAARRRRA